MRFPTAAFLREHLLKPSELLEEDLKERPFATRQERCEYVRAVSGVSVSFRKAAARTKEALVEAIGAALSAVTIAEASCERKIFCERLPEVAARTSKMDRLGEALLAIISELGGRAGCRGGRAPR